MASHLAIRDNTPKSKVVKSAPGGGGGGGGGGWGGIDIYSISLSRDADIYTCIVLGGEGGGGRGVHTCF